MWPTLCSHRYLAVIPPIIHATMVGVRPLILFSETLGSYTQSCAIDNLRPSTAKKTSSSLSGSITCLQHFGRARATAWFAPQISQPARNCLFVNACITCGGVYDSIASIPPLSWAKSWWFKSILGLLLKLTNLPLPPSVLRLIGYGLWLSATSNF